MSFIHSRGWKGQHFFFPSFFFLFLMGFVTGTLSPKTMKENRLISKKKKKKKKKKIK